MNETEVISCPACKHIVRVPSDWLGTDVQCPECQAKFTAPRREGDKLTEAILISTPAPKSPPRRRTDLMLMLPAFGLMLVGFTSAAINTWTSIRYFRDPAATEQDVKDMFKNWSGEKPVDEKQIEEVATKGAPWIRTLVTVFAFVGAFVFFGGVSIIRGRNYRVAQVACILATLNLANGCCLPGAIFGLWAMLLLNSDEGREHFS